ncbi:MAG: hypothetical protein ABIP35_02245 [Ginsengibacter sp.]
MKKKILFSLVFMASIAATANLYAQENARPDLKVKTKSNIKNDKVSIVKITSTDEGCSIVVGNEIVSPRDAASGLPTGKRMHKPFVITKELGVSSKDNGVTEIKTPRDAASGQATGKRMAGGPIGGIVVKGGKNPGGGQFNNLVVEDGQFTLPADCPDGEYTMILSWSWGASNSGSAKQLVKSFKLTMENGVCKGINEAGVR